jgi:2-(1,2-epoxy-1,2-dihydrophenyl)acetyl-CoA isomerase
MSAGSVSLSVENGIGRLVLNRPEKLNSFNAALHSELRRALQSLENSATRVLIISGAGKGFCAGQDLAEREGVARGESIDLGASIEANYKPLALALAACRFPLIARVQGVAAGAGASLALACDLCIAGRSASFAQSFVRIGLVPDMGGTWQLPRRVGLARAMGLALLGERIGAQQAADWGLIWQCVDDDQLDAAVNAAAATLAALPAAALTAIKGALRGSGAHTLEQQLNIERDLQRELGHSADYREGVAAFLAKRTPHYGG